MSIIKAVKIMEFVCVNTNDYRYEPDIEFTFNGKTRMDGQQYTYDEFINIIDTCKKYGIEHDHLTACLPEFEREMDLFARMKPEQQIPAGM